MACFVLEVSSYTHPVWQIEVSSYTHPVWQNMHMFKSLIYKELSLGLGV
jgi:ribosomal protein L31